MKEYYELLAEVVCKLAQKPVQLRFKHNEGLNGLTRADSSGMLTIDIDPELKRFPEKLLKVLLHETAHAKYDNFIPVSFEVSDRVPFEKSEYANHRELRAEAQAGAWFLYAEQHRSKNLNYFEGCLRALYEL